MFSYGVYATARTSSVPLTVTFEPEVVVMVTRAASFAPGTRRIQRVAGTMTRPKQPAIAGCAGGGVVGVSAPPASRAAAPALPRRGAGTRPRTNPPAAGGAAGS